jgi:hypothetical protein
MTAGVCPQCKVNVVVRTKKFGTLPRCDECLEKNKRGRYDRRNAKVRAGRSVHHAANGERYPDKSTLMEVVCAFCGDPFQRSSKVRGRAVCPTCQPKADEERREKNRKKVQALYWRDPTEAKHKRMRRTLTQMGLNPDWYEKQPKLCGICGTDDPGEKGWHIDHDHTCCPPGVRQGCSNCVRGLLCSNCNTGLGHFKDDPVRLRAAIAWVQRSRA